jgi:hypothetical protein
MGKPKGSPKTGGRVAGTPNKVNSDIKEMVLGALQDVGGRQYLAARAIDSPGPFLTLVGKILPTQLTGENGAPIAVDFRWADATPEPPTIEIDADETTVVSFIVADETNDA